MSEGQDKSPKAADDLRRLVHELQVHKIELESQNEALRQSRAEAEAAAERYADLYEFAPMGYLTLDGRGAIQRINFAGAELLGADRAALLKRRFAVFVVPDDRAAFDAFIHQAFIGTGKASCELAILDAAGNHRHVHIDAAAEDGPECRLVLMDITDRKRMEERLRESEARFTVLARQSPVGIFESNPQGDCLFVNAYWLAIAGLSEAQAAGKGWIEGIHPEDRARVFAEWYAAAAADRDFALEYRFRAPSGKVTWVAGSARPIRDAAGRTIRHSGMVLDITERRLAEQEREITIEFLRFVNVCTSTRELIAAALTFFQQRSGCEAVGIRLKDGDDYPYYESRGFSHEFLLVENSLCTRDSHGTPLRDSEGNPFIECMCGNVICGRFDPAKPFFTQHGSFWTNGTTELLASTSDADRQTRTRNRCNGEGYESVALMPLRVGEDRLGLLQLNDRRKGIFSLETILSWERLAGYLAVALAGLRAEESLRKSVDELARSNKDLEQFAYVASHDLKEPLRMVTGFMSLLQDHCRGRLDAKADEYIGFAADAAHRMRQLVDDLLLYSRVARGETSAAVDVGTVLDGALRSLAVAIDESGAIITRDALPTIAANALELTLVFQNLVGNAIKFRARHAPEIHIVAQRQDSGWRFSVRDNGIGIDPQFTERVFMIFQRLHTREQYPGTGIGLAICRKIIERHGGRIWVESIPDKGAEFSFTIPDAV